MKTSVIAPRIVLGLILLALCIALLFLTVTQIAHISQASIGWNGYTSIGWNG